MTSKVRALWRSRLLTAQRPQGEVAQMQWGEVDLDGAWWTIPGSKSKNRIPHHVPLPATVVQLLREIRPGKDPKPEAFVFAGFTRDPQVRTGAAFPLPDFQPRDLRKTARTRIAEDGVPEEGRGRVESQAARSDRNLQSTSLRWRKAAGARPLVASCHGDCHECSRCACTAVREVCMTPRPW